MNYDLFIKLFEILQSYESAFCEQRKKIMTLFQQFSSKSCFFRHYGEYLCT